MANPNWSRDMEWLIRQLRREAEKGDIELKSAMFEAIDAAQRYKAAGGDEVWDEMLTAIDWFLEIRHLKHLAAVDEAGTSCRG